MSTALRIITSAVLAIPLLLGAAFAAVPSSGTLSPLTPLLTYTAGPFTGANPSANALDEPDCNAVPGTCDDYMLTIDVPPNYFTLNPDHVVTITVGWPTATFDFDVFVQDPNTGTSVTTSATSSDPEIALLDPIAGVFRIRTVAFAVVNQSIAGTITLGPRPESGIGAGQYVASDDVFSCNTHLDGDAPLFNHGADGEPAVKFTKDGVAWVGGIAGVPAGNGLWKVTDSCAQEYTFVDLTDLTVGGGDIDIEVAPERNPITNQYNIYMSSLWLGNITSVTSIDGGNTFTPVVVSDPVPVNDRQWNAAYGPLTLYLSWRSLNTGNQLFIERSDNGGLTFGPPIPVYDDVVGTVLATQLGNLAVDTRPVPVGTLPLMSGPDGEANVYHGYILTTQTLTGGHSVYVAVSKDFGTTWESKLVFQGPVGALYDHVFSWLAVDADGNIYTTWSDGENIYYSFSTDQGDTWSRPIRVNSGSGTKTSIFPMVEAGSAGRIIFGWYGSSANGVSDATAEWHYFHSRCNNALDAVPLFEATRVSDHVVKTGAVCLDGLNCACCRELLELAEVAINPVDGSSFITYATSGLDGVFMSRQLAGTSAIDGATIVDRSLVCPSLENLCDIEEPPTGDPCNPPGVEVLTDPSGDFNAAGSPAYDILSVSMADPGTGAAKRLVATLKVASLDPNNLPLNSIWRVLWVNPSDSNTYFVSMTTCDPMQIPAFDYGWIDPMTGVQTGLGTPENGTVSADGTIQIRVAPSVIGNPTLGTTLTGVNGTTRLLVGAACTGLITAIDGTSGGTYTLNCTPVATLLSDMEIYETNGGIEISWSSRATDQVRAWNVYRAAAAEGPWEQANPAEITMGSSGRFRFLDSTPITGTVFYRIGAVLFDGTEEQQPVISYEIGRKPFTFALAGANPFREQTLLSYSLGTRSPVSIAVYSVAGRRLRTLVDRVQEPGRYAVALHRVDDSGSRLAAGVYLVRLTAGSHAKNLRVVVVH